MCYCFTTDTLGQGRRQIPCTYGKQASSHGCLEGHWNGCKKDSGILHSPIPVIPWGGDRKVCGRNLILLTCLVDSLKILDGQNVPETWENFWVCCLRQNYDSVSKREDSWLSAFLVQWYSMAEIRILIKNWTKRSGNRNDYISVGTEHGKSIRTMGKMSFLC